MLSSRGEGGFGRLCYFTPLPRLPMAAGLRFYSETMMRHQLPTVLVIGLLAFSSGPACAASDLVRGARISGQVQRVLDGDTIEMLHQGEPVHVRLTGIDAPEDGQSCLDPHGAPFDCGREATRQLAQLIGGRERTCPSQRLHGLCLASSDPVVCDVRDVDRKHVPNRPVAVCRSGTLDLSESMVKEGWAYAFTAFDRRYAPIGAITRALRRGFWSGRFDNPAELRQARAAAGR